MDFADILIRSALRNSDPIVLEGCRVPVSVTLKPLAASEDEMIAAAMRQEAAEAAPTFNRAKATAEDVRALATYNARQIARYQVASLTIGGEDYTARAEEFLLSWAAANPVAIMSLAAAAVDVKTFGGEGDAGIPTEEIAGNSPGA